MRFFLFSILLLLSFTPQLNTIEAAKPLPKCGYLMLIGGGSLTDQIKQCFIEYAGKDKANIVIIPTASDLPNIEERCLKEWKTDKYKYKLDFVCEVSDAFKIKTATAVFIGGGDQNKLSKLYKETEVEKELLNLLKRGGIIGGTSAGASIFSNIMPYSSGEAAGFGFVDYIVDQHFTQRSRLTRLQKLLDKHSDLKGIGIDESTAVIFEGSRCRVIGENSVYYYENAKTNKKLKAGDFFYIENKGKYYSLSK